MKSLVKKTFILIGLIVCSSNAFGVECSESGWPNGGCSCFYKGIKNGKEFIGMEASYTLSDATRRALFVCRDEGGTNCEITKCIDDYSNNG